MNKQNALMLITIVGLVAFIFMSKTSSNKGEIYILATDKQVACLKNIVFENEFEIEFLSSPVHFKKLKVFKIYSSESDDEVRIHYSSCLTSRHAVVAGGVKNLPSLYTHFKNSGAKDIGIFKSQDSDEIHLYSFE